MKLCFCELIFGFEKCEDDARKVTTSDKNSPELNGEEMANIARSTKAPKSNIKTDNNDNDTNNDFCGETQFSYNL